jgi:hypothetical protein
VLENTMTDAIEHLLAEEFRRKQMLQHSVTLHQAYIHQAQLHALQNKPLTSTSSSQVHLPQHHTVTPQHVDVDV